ncbi:MAG: leucine-rich repeat protein [Oscillospiraceae bacterium]|nr:leucine-rich repeat protein [Oscillospiraceae bacterium]
MKPSKILSMILAVTLLLTFIPSFTPAVLASNETEFAFNETTGTVTGYTGSSLDIEIPGTINGITVKAIGAWAFANQSDITNITIPNSVISIGDSAFEFCYALESIVIPDNVVTIGEKAFGSHSKLASVTIGSSVETIGYQAFRGDQFSTPALASIHIPASVTSIGDRVFERCSSLAEITVDESNPAYADIDGVLFNKAETRLIRYPENKTGITYDVPEGVTAISAYAFEYSQKLTKITIPEGVTHIEERTFNYCTDLTDVTLPDGLKSIGNHAFYWCSSLLNINFPDGLESIGEETFDQCSSLNNAINNMPDSVYSIGSRAFFRTNWYSSSDAVTPRVMYVGKVAYEWIGVMPENTELIQSNTDPALKLRTDTTGIADLAFSNDNFTQVGNNLESIDIPDSVVHIGYRAFYSNEGLTGLNLGSGVKTIDREAFMYCTALESITIPNSVETIGSMASASGGAFYGCVGLTDVTFENGLKSIGAGTFSGCSGLTDIELPNGLEKIGSRAFENCTDLVGIIVPDSVESVGFHAFNSTPWFNAKPDNSLVYVGMAAYQLKGSMSSVRIADGTKSISELAFGYKTGLPRLTSVIIPDSVKRIDKEAFIGSTNLESVFIMGKTVSIGENAFHRSIGGSPPAYVPLNIKFCGLLGSDAESYALTNGIPFAEYRTINITASPATGGTVSAPELVEADTQVSVTANASTEYDFNGWYENGVKVSDANPYDFTAATNRTLEAKFSEIQYYTVTYHANDATGGTVPVDSTLYRDNGRVWVAFNSGNLEREGYIFAGWTLTEDGTGAIYGPVDGITVNSANVNFYAKWTQADITTHSVYYDTVNGSGTLTATVDGAFIFPGGSVEQGKSVVFTATPAEGYRVRKWEDNYTAVNGKNSGYIISNIAQIHTVTVEFEPLPLIPPSEVIIPNDGPAVVEKTDGDAAVITSDDIQEIAAADTSLIVTLPTGKIYLTPETVSGLANTDSAITVEITVTLLSDLNEAQQTNAGLNLVVDINVFADGIKFDVPMTVALPYTLKQGEQAANVKVWYMDDDGRLEELSGSYDTVLEMIAFAISRQSYYVVGYDDPHSHNHGTDWKRDAAGHWNECDCGDKANLAAHTPGSWTTVQIVTATVNGRRQRACTICGFITNTETIPAAGNAAIPNINVQPQKTRTVDRNKTAALTIAASVGRGVLSYQWFSVGSNKNSGGTRINGATGRTYNAPTGTAGTTRWYYCVVTNTDNAATGNKTATRISNAVSVTVRRATAITPKITRQPKGKNNVRRNTAFNLSVTARRSGNNTISYQWQRSNKKNSGFKNIKGSAAKRVNYKAPTNKKGTAYYRCIVTNTDNGATRRTNTRISNTVMVKVR